jgi:hypothetical protein
MCEEVGGSLVKSRISGVCRTEYFHRTIAFLFEEVGKSLTGSVSREFELDSCRGDEGGVMEGTVNFIVAAAFPEFRLLG